MDADAPRLTVEDALRMLEAREQEFREFRVPVRTLRVEPMALVVEGARLTMDRASMRRFCRQAGAPVSYLFRLSRDLRAQLLQHHVDRADLGEFVAVVSRDDGFVGFANSGLLRLREPEVVRAVLDGIPADAGPYIDSFHVDDDELRLDLVAQATTEEVAPGDVVAAGLRITHSVLGRAATRIESFMVRRVCANGLISHDCVKSERTRRLPINHPNAHELQVEQVRRLAREAWSLLSGKLAAFRDLLNERVDVEQLLRTWVRRAGLSHRRLLPALIVAWEAEGGAPTVYAAVNALSRLATHGLHLSLRQRRILAGMAGLLVGSRSDGHLCPRCFSILRQPVEAVAREVEGR